MPNQDADGSIVSIPLGQSDHGADASGSSDTEDGEVWVWQSDMTANFCSNPGCMQEFWLMRRRHHCRPCGRVFCRSCCVRERGGSRRCHECRRLCDPRSGVLRQTALARHTAKRAALVCREACPDAASNKIPELRRLLSNGPPKKVFRVGRRIGSGAFGDVYQARDNRVGDLVALKIIPLRGIDEASLLAQRTQIASEVACHHAAVTSCFDDEVHFPRLYSVFENQSSGLSGGHRAVWLVMEYIDGDTLADFLRVEYPMPASGKKAVVMKVDAQTSLIAPPPAEDDVLRRQRSIQTLDLTKMDQPVDDVSNLSRPSRGIADERIIAHFTQQLVDALNKIHSAGVIFRDLKPDNIICVSDPFSDRKTLRIVDFGGAIKTSGGTDKVADGLLIGSPAYMAPESWNREYSFASDIWALGCVVYEMAMGVAPFQCIADKVAALAAQLPQEGTDERKDAVAALRQRMRKVHAGMRVYMQHKGPQPRGQETAWTTLCWSDEIIDFVGKCLQADASKRWSCQELMSHPFLVRHTAGHARSIAEVDCEVAYARLQKSGMSLSPTETRRYGPSLLELRPGEHITPTCQ
eukprot:TRINITY_DN8914_c0_g1_i1.p1 TRINITY_DN8914_c0_g1~~TRINITY_DN8914_c0_g1_i1.p1  ORF type:complete len:579 (+),score=135.97 TRINITY_DN8914_c0_g1_i1:80-1816(+)